MKNFMYETPPPEDFFAPRPPGAGQLLAFTLLFLVIQIIFMVLVTVIGRLVLPDQETFIMLGAGLLATVMWGVAAWFWVYVRELPRDFLRMDLPRVRPWFWLVMLLTVPLVVVVGSNLDMLVFHAFPSLFKPDSTLEAFSHATMEHPLAWVFIIGLAVVAAPVCEEMYFRGLMFRSLRLRRWRLVFSLVFTSVLFSAIHMKLAGFFLLFTVAVVLGLYAEFSRSLLPAVLFHAAYNAFVLAISLGSQWFSKPEMQPFSLEVPEAVLPDIPPLGTILGILAIAGVVLVYLVHLGRKAFVGPRIES